MQTWFNVWLVYSTLIILVGKITLYQHKEYKNEIIFVKAVIFFLKRRKLHKRFYFIINIECNYLSIYHIDAHTQLEGYIDG